MSDDYIEQSSVAILQADRNHNAVRAGGSVVTGNHGWFLGSDNVWVRLRDAIVVPLSSEKLAPLTLWQSVDTILYNLAIAASEAQAVL